VDAQQLRIGLARFRAEDIANANAGEAAHPSLGHDLGDGAAETAD